MNVPITSHVAFQGCDDMQLQQFLSLLSSLDSNSSGKSAQKFLTLRFHIARRFTHAPGPSGSTKPSIFASFCGRIVTRQPTWIGTPCVFLVVASMRWENAHGSIATHDIPVSFARFASSSRSFIGGPSGHAHGSSNAHELSLSPTRVLHAATQLTATDALFAIIGTQSRWVGIHANATIDSSRAG